MDETDVERGRQLVRDLLADDAAHSDALEWTMHTADGDRFPCESHISLLDESAGLRGTTGVVRDVTDRKERQRELERQNERLEEFAGIVSHDLRNPLAVAQSRLELLASSVDSPHADPLATSLDRMEAIIDDTLLLARQGESVAETERVDAAAIAESSWAVVETDAATLSAESVTLDADPDRLRHVFENLFRNAIKHGTPADGDDPIADEPLRVRVERLADDTGFAVEDDGPGIPPDDRDVVFEGGYSTSADGTGFGLSIVKRIVEAHGWTVTATEGTDGGARFEITGVDSLG
jgi:signal transduction histidine kinase